MQWTRRAATRRTHVCQADGERTAAAGERALCGEADTRAAAGCRRIYASSCLITVTLL